MSTTFTVYGSYGRMTCQTGTGLVLDYDPEQGVEPVANPAYADIVRVDLAEFLTAYPGEDLCALADIDVVDIGFWSDTGTYFAAEPVYRANAREGLCERAAHKAGWVRCSRGGTGFDLIDPHGATLARDELSTTWEGLCLNEKIPVRALGLFAGELA